MWKRKKIILLLLLCVWERIEEIIVMIFLWNNLSFNDKKNFFVFVVEKFAFVYDNCAFISLNEYEIIWPSKGSWMHDVHEYLGFLRQPHPLWL